LTLFYKKVSNPKKLLDHSVGTRRVAEVRPTERQLVELRSQVCRSHSVKVVF